MEAVFVIGITLLLLAGIGLVVAIGHRRMGLRATEWARKYARVVELPCSCEAAHELCHQGLSEVLGTMTSERRRRGEFGAWSGLDDAPAEMHRLEFAVETAGTGTRVTIRSTAATGLWTQTMAPRTTRDRRRQVDRLADWLEQQPC